jgi:hypothetical protein
LNGGVKVRAFGDRDTAKRTIWQVQKKFMRILRSFLLYICSTQKLLRVMVAVPFSLIAFCCLHRRELR